MNLYSTHIKVLVSALLLLFLTIESTAQTKKFGKVSKEDFTAYNPVYDSTMSAVVLFSKGEVEYDSDYSCYYEFHKRVKILNDDGFEYGDIQIPFYTDLDQNVSSIKATTYTLMPDGKIEQTKLGRRDVFEDKIVDDLRVKKFTMPALAAGVIIEYSYKKRVGHPAYLPDWKFHDYIPVQWSEYKMEIPLTLDYRMIFKGSDTLYQNKVSRLTRSQGDAQEIYLAKKELPAVEDLPYLINRDDHISEVITQLQGIRIPGYPPRNFFKDWPSIAEEVNKREDFGGQRANGAIKDAVAEIVSDEMEPIQKLEIIYNYMTSNFNWDGRHRVITEKGIRNTFKDKEGNTADLNLLLVEMLKEAGIKANPALISTRTNGSVILDYPLINQFNSTIAVAELTGAAFALDASTGIRSYKATHPKNMYRNAFVIREDNSFGWLTTVPIESSSERLSLTYSFDEAPRVSVKLMGSVKGEFAEEMRNNVKSINYNSYWENEYSTLPDIKVDSSSFKNLENLTESITYSTDFSFEKGDYFSTSDDLIYLNPFMFLSRQENPFKRNERELPVEFSHTYSKQYLVNLKIPDGYVVEEMPESKQVAIPNRGGSYRFITSATDSSLTFVSNIRISAYRYETSEYPLLKDLFQNIVDTQNAIVVLRKEEGSE
ncbi:MAG: DUF3857 domain-containing protein [Balneolaceae bacterium]